MSATDLRKTKNITAILTEAGVVTPERVLEGLARQGETGRRIGETLVELGAATEEEIAWALAQQLALAFVDLPLDAVDLDLVRSFGEDTLRRLQAVPLVREEGGLSVAVADPTDAETVAALEGLVRGRLHLGVATPSRIRLALDHVFGNLDPARAEIAPRAAGRPTSALQETATAPRAELEILQSCVSEALRAGASEIHVLGGRRVVEVHHRIESRLVRCAEPPAGWAERLVRQLEVAGLPRLGEAEQRCGRVVVCLEGQIVTLDVAVVRDGDGISACLQLRTFADRTPALSALGLGARQLRDVRSMLAQPAGVVLLVAPPRAGVSTTLAAMLWERPVAAGRVVCFGGGPAVGPPGSTVVPGTRAEHLASWADIAIGQAADVVVLDRVLALDNAEEVFSAAAYGRLVLASCTGADWRAVLRPWLERGRLREAIGERLLGLLSQRLLRGERLGAAGDGRRAHFETLRFGPDVREALARGAGYDELLRAGDSFGWPETSELCRRERPGGATLADGAARGAR